MFHFVGHSSKSDCILIYQNWNKVYQQLVHKFTIKYMARIPRYYDRVIFKCFLILYKD